ncbi:toll/interleukin-1 receptor domain-containing protein [Vibrio splendidus]
MRNKVFLSHAHEDKDLVGQIAEELRQAFGEDRIFYDSWSMKPGESLIGKMSEGLDECSHFFLFMSAVSLEKPMVRLEWHNGLIKSLKDASSFIPVRIDNISPPEILTTTLYIDMYNRGLPQTIEDMNLLINGQGLYNPSKLKPFNNFHVTLEQHKDKELKISINAKKLTEPVNRFALWISDGAKATAYGMSTTSSGKLSFNGTEREVQVIEQNRTITPGNPQDYYITTPGDDFNIEVFHLPTPQNVNPIFSSNVNMHLLKA